MLAVTKCGIDSIEVNSLINMKVEANKLRLSDEKCILIHVSKSCEPCDNNLKVHEKNMKKKHISSVSLGFQFFNISFTLRESMLLNGMLFNCEAWNCITEKQVETRYALL